MLLNVLKNVLIWTVFVAAILTMAAGNVHPLVNLGGLLVTLATALYIAMY